MSNDFNEQELQRYSRHFSVKKIGLAGQHKLKQAKVLCIGAGGIGSPLLQYLTAMGVGEIGIVDHDQIELSNLQRQILFAESNIGNNKAEIAKQKLQLNNSNIKINAHPVKLTAKNAEQLIPPYDLVIDGSDNYPTRYLSNDACCLLNKPLVMASIFQFSGQLATFNLNNSGCYRCLFPEAPTAELIPNCAQAGVLGVLPGIVANLAALEVVKVILELEGTLQNQLLSFEGLLYELKKFPYQKNKNCLCQKSSFDLKKLHQAKPATNTQAEDFEIDLTSFNRMRSNNPDLVILDVREEWERLINKIENSLHQPLDQLDQLDLTPLKNKTIVCYCAKGGRSKIAALALKKKGLKNTLSLAGGINSIFL